AAYQHGMALILLGRVAMAMDQIQEARSISDELLNLIDAHNIPLLEFPAHMLCAQIAEHEGELAVATELYRRAAESIEVQRSYLHHDELRIRFVDGRESVYEALVLHTATDDPEQALMWSESAKSRALADIMGQHLPALTTQTDPGLLEHIRRLREELNSQYVRARPDGGELEAPSDEQILETEQALEAAIQKMSDADAEFGSLFGVKPGSLEELQSCLSDDTTIVEYFIARGEILAFIISKTDLKVVRRLCSLEKIQQLKQSLQFQMQKFVLGAGFVSKHLEQIQQATNQYLQSLFEALITPCLANLSTEKLVIIPHGDLHGLPFHAFFDGEAHLIDHYAVAYAPSCEVFKLTSSGADIDVKTGMLFGYADDNAPLIDSELAEIHSSRPGLTTISGPEATRNNFFAAVTDQQFLHIATHSFFRRDNPMFSGFQLADGPVTALDLYSKHWPLSLVTLSGCSSGVTTIAGGDDLVGLIRGFFHAGCRSVLATLWHVDDAATSELATTFYRSWFRHQDKSKALQQAMIETRAHHPHPFYWASFTLNGAN
ncbi:MAG: CHAT domain-containing protein, partial [Pseudomonadales bacterium]